MDSITSLADMFDDDTSEEKEIPLDKIFIDKDLPQPRTIFKGIDQLAESIKAQGVIEPIILVHDEDNDRYILIVGERRYRASKKAGKTTIPAVIRDLTRKQIVAMRLVENIDREGFELIDEINGIQQAIDELGSAKAVGDAMGKSASWISKRTKIVKAPAEILQFVKDGFSGDIEAIYTLANAAEKNKTEVLEFIDKCRQDQDSCINLREQVAAIGKKKSESKASETDDNKKSEPKAPETEDKQTSDDEGTQGNDNGSNNDDNSGPENDLDNSGDNEDEEVKTPETSKKERQEVHIIEDFSIDGDKIYLHLGEQKFRLAASMLKKINSEL